jgi:hypothetical protein
MASFFGPVTYRVESAASRITACVELDEQRAPQELVLQVRRPDEQAIRSVMVNGRAHADFGAETVRVPSPGGRLQIQVRYA